MSAGRTRTARFELTVGLHQADAFAYFSDVDRLNEVTPPWFRLDPTAQPPRRLAAGTVIDYRFSWRRLPLRWRSRITAWDPPRYFVYEQERGPYRFFRHEHHFEAVEGGTRVVDVVVFRTALGSLFDRWLVERDVERVFAHRRAYVEQRFPLGVAARPEGERVDSPTLAPYPRSAGS